MNNPKEILVLGDEAMGHAAMDSGLKTIFSYPGTPSTEIFECVEDLIKKKNDGRVACWAANEKVAYEMALGASYTGQRTMTTMKHVGLNVAMDPFVNSALTEVRGGFVVAVADDPGMHSSQNEQDTRYLCDFALIPCLEPSTPQEVYAFTCKAYEISERFRTPVVIRLVTRLAHARGVITRGEEQAISHLGVPPQNDKDGWILMPVIARKQYVKLREKIPAFLEEAKKFNKIQNNNSKIGIIASGMGRAYFNQVARENADVKAYSVFHIAAYPLDKNDLAEFVNAHQEIYVFEENFPYIEDQVINLASKSKIHGRRDGTLLIAGELSPLLIRKAFKLPIPESKGHASLALVGRAPRLCTGCGHEDAYRAINEAFAQAGITDPRIFGDIGCYTLGALPPYTAISTCVEMGASAGMALGAAYAGHVPAVGVLGDSTFFHSALPTLMMIAKAKVNITLVVMDNRITGMTGQQPTIVTDTIPQLAKAAGFPEENIHNFIPLPKNHEENTQAFKKILSHDGPDIVIFKRECIQAIRKGIYKEIDKDKATKGKCGCHE
jgi:indolepyruvate ferredoxin oxidoreductase alpha subunit